MTVVLDDRAARILERLSRGLDDPRPFLLPANVCAVVPQTLADSGRRMRFVDIARGDLTMDRGRCVDMVARDSEGFAALLFVRTYGVDGNEMPFFQAVRQAAPHALIIDDKCLCRPDCDGLALSPGADVTLFSTGYAKHVDLGGGGFAHITTDRMFADVRPVADGVWREYRERTLSALEAADEHKAILNAIYEADQPSSIRLPRPFQQWRFNILVSRSEQLIGALRDSGLFASRHYQPVTGRFTDERFPASEWLHGRVVNLFNDRYYTIEQCRQTNRVIRRHLGLPSG